MKSFFKGMLVAILTVCGAMSAYAQDGYTIQRLSNPGLGPSMLDGYIEGGMHGNDYTQSMTALGDYVLIATSANLGYAFTRRYNPNWNFWYIAKELYNGRFPFYDPEDTDSYDGARIIAYDTRNGKFSVLYEGENGVGYRCATTSPDGNYAYFAAYSADSRVKPYILRITKSSNLRPEKCEKYFETNDCVALRGFCKYGNRVYFAGADEREDATNLIASKPVKLAVLEVHGTTTVRVADYKDFGTVAYDETLKAWNDSPIFDIASYGGYIYVSIPSEAGFVIFRGRPATDEEITAKKNNSYKWIWEEVAGLNNGVNNPALSETAGGEPGNLSMLSGTFFVFNDRLYVTNSYHSIMGELSVFADGIKNLTEQPFNAISYLNFMYAVLQAPQKVWKLDNLTGKFNLQPAFTQNLLSTMNARFGEYDGQLYVATLDAGYAYSWISQIAIDDFIHLSPADIIAKLTIVDDIIKALTGSSSSRKAKDSETDALLEQLEQLESFLLQLLKNDVDNTTDIANVTDIISVENLLNLFKLLGTSSTAAPTGSATADYIADLLKLLGGDATGTATGIANCNILDILQLLTGGSSETTVPSGTGTIASLITLADILKALGIVDFPELKDFSDIADMPLSDWKEFIDTIIVRILQDRFGFEGDATDLPILDITSLTNYQEILDEILRIIKETLGVDIALDDTTTADALYLAILQNLMDNVYELFESLETSALNNYVFIFNRMRTNKMGFDLMRTSDGHSFEFITRNGLGDMRNFGCPCFATTADGLYIGTSNPYFGGQLYLMTNISGNSSIRLHGTDGDDADALQSISASDAQGDYFTLDGRRVSGKAAQKGIYIHNGKKVLVK